MSMMANNFQRARRPVFDLDAANFTGVPTNGTIVNGFPLSVANLYGTLSRNSNNGGSFVNQNTTSYQYDYISGGPNYETGKSYTVFMAYKLIAGTNDPFGRLLTATIYNNKDWIMGSYNSQPKTFYPNTPVSLYTYPLDDIWHLDFVTWNTSTYTGTLYATTDTGPTNYLRISTDSSGGGFNGLRLFSLSTGNYPHRGHIAFVKVYDDVLTLPEMQSLYNTYKARFGY